MDMDVFLLRKRHACKKWIRENFFFVLILAAFTGMLFLHVLGLEVVYHTSKHVIFCPFHKATGLQCPGCGMTRAFWALSAMHFKEALQYNPFSLPLLGLTILHCCGMRFSNNFWDVILIIVFAWWLTVRVLPVYW